MQSVFFTPPRVEVFVREALAALRYQSHVDSNGMFFLHTLDLGKTPCLEDILNKDDALVLSLLGGALPQVTPRPQREQSDSEIENRYPLGPKPSWAEITASLKDNPSELMPRWSFPHTLEKYQADEGGHSTMALAGRIFTRMSLCLWTAVQPLQFTTQGEDMTTMPVRPTTVEEALECWSVDAVRDVLSNPEFRPCRSEFQGAEGPRTTKKFGERRELYLPDEEAIQKQNLPQLWQVFMDESTGYLGLYHKVLRRLDSEEIIELNGCIDELLSHCQCLPDSYRMGKKGQMWTAEKGKLILLANPAMYKIQGIGKRKAAVRQRTRGMLAQRGLQDIATQLLINEGITPEAAKKSVGLKKKSVKALQRAKLKRRSAKSKNKRIPPQRKSRAQGEEMNVEEENEEDVDDMPVEEDNDIEHDNDEEMPVEEDNEIEHDNDEEMPMEGENEEEDEEDEEEDTEGQLTGWYGDNEDNSE